MSDLPCPTRAQLENLIAGRLAVETHQAVEEHVLGCENCQAAIDALEEPQDAFLATLHEAIDPAAVRASRPFQQALARLRSFCEGPNSGEFGYTSTGPPNSGEFGYTSMTPPNSGEFGDTAAPNPGEFSYASFSDFRIIAELGRGGMGIVYEAEQLSLNRRVALKILPFAALVSARQLQRFQNEARAAASLEHPNIVPVYGVGAERGVHYFAMQFIDGRNLAQIIEHLRKPAQQVGPDSSPTQSVHFDQTQTNQSGLQDLLARRAPEDPAFLGAAVRIGIQAARALDHAREHSIVHRDIKPSNLMLDRRGKLWVTDFGLARMETSPSMSQTGAVVGTLRYMSPEQVLDDLGVVDHRSDVYSLGATLYELLTLTALFAGVSHESLRRMIALDEPQAPRRLNPRIPADLETIVLKAMAKDRAERYATAGDFAADLQRFLDGKPICARAIGPHRRALKWARRRPAVAALVAVSLLALGVIFGGGWWHAASLQLALTASDKLRIAVDEQRQAAVEQEALARKQALRVRQFLYAADMKLAFGAWKSNHVAELLDLLKRHQPTNDDEEDLRTFVWHYLWRLCHGELLALRGHVADVHCVAFSPDGRRLATASHDGTAKLWDLAHGTDVMTFLKGHTDQLNTVAFSPDGQTLATGSDDHQVRLWDAASGQERVALVGHGDDVNTVAYSPDGTILASGGADKIVKLWDASTGIELTTLAGHRGGIESLTFSADGRTLASASGDCTAIVWDISTRQPRMKLQGHDDDLRSVAFAHSRPIVATGSEDRSVKLWNAATGQVLATLRGHQETVRSVAFSPDDRTLAVAVKDGSVWLWDLEKETVRRTIRGHTGRIWHAAFSPDGRTLATASGDRTAKVWDAQIDKLGRVASGLPAPVTVLAFSPDGRQLVAAAPWDTSDSCFLVRDVATGVERREVHRAGQGFGHAAFSPDGASVVMARYEKMEHAFADQWQCRTCMLHVARELSTLGLYSIALSPDHRTLATADNHTLATADNQNTILWDLATGRERIRIATVPSILVTSLAFSLDGKILATGRQDGLGQLWNVETGKERAMLRGHSHEVFQVAFSPDGRTLATASRDRTVKLWDVATGAEQTTLQGHVGQVRAVAFSPDGKTVASGSDDATIRLWDIATRQELIVLESHQGGVRSVAFSPDGKVLASGGAALDGQGEIFLWPPAGDAR